MKKTYCDKCDCEIEDGKNWFDLRVDLKLNNAQSMIFRFIKFNEVDERDICKYCVIDAVKALDDRTKVECGIGE